MTNNTSYIKVASHEAVKGTFKRCLLLYSGGLDTSVMLKWIQEEYNCEVIALSIDIGQTSDNLQLIKRKALKLGAKEAIVYNAKNEFADKFFDEEWEWMDVTIRCYLLGEIIETVVEEMEL